MSSALNSEECRAVADLVHSTAIKLLRRLRREDVASGLSPARASLLSILVFVGEKRLAELADLEQVARPTMTKLIHGLARDGLVKCSPDERDGRAVLVRATPSGSKLLHEGRRRRVDALAELLAPLPARELAALSAATRRLAALLGVAAALPPGRGSKRAR